MVKGNFLLDIVAHISGSGMGSIENCGIRSPHVVGNGDGVGSYVNGHMEGGGRESMRTLPKQERGRRSEQDPHCAGYNSKTTEAL